MFRSERYPSPWQLSGELPPIRIEQPGIVLRCWEKADAPLFDTAFRASRAHVSAWIPPARDEPTDLDAIRLRLERFQAEFHAGIGFVYAIFDETETAVLGEIGLMPRVGPGALEIGYWVHVDHVGRGIATEATHALTVAGLALPEVDHIEIHCDPANVPSATIPRRLGYQLMEADVRSDIIVFTMDDIGTLIS